MIAEHSLAGGPDHERRPTGPWAARQKLAVGEAVVGAVEVAAAGGEELPNDRERFLESADPMVVGEAVGVVLGAIPAGAEAEDEPAVADLVDGRGLLRQHRGVVEAGGRDQRTELDPLRDSGERGQDGPDLPRAARRPAVVAVEEMVADPDRVEADALRGRCHLAQLAPPDGALDLGQLDPHLQRS